MPIGAILAALGSYALGRMGKQAQADLEDDQAKKNEAFKRLMSADEMERQRTGRSLFDSEAGIAALKTTGIKKERMDQIVEASKVLAQVFGATSEGRMRISAEQQMAQTGSGGETPSAQEIVSRAQGLPEEARLSSSAGPSFLQALTAQQTREQTREVGARADVQTATAKRIPEMTTAEVALMGSQGAVNRAQVPLVEAQTGVQRATEQRIQRMTGPEVADLESQRRLREANIARMQDMTPAEVAKIHADIDLTKRQGKRIEDMTPAEVALMEQEGALRKATADRIRTMTPAELSEYQARTKLHQAQADILIPSQARQNEARSEVDRATAGTLIPAQARNLEKHGDFFAVQAQYHPETIAIHRMHEETLRTGNERQYELQQNRNAIDWMNAATNEKRLAVEQRQIELTKAWHETQERMNRMTVAGHLQAQLVQQGYTNVPGLRAIGEYVSGQRDALPEGLAMPTGINRQSVETMRALTTQMEGNRKEITATLEKLQSKEMQGRPIEERATILMGPNGNLLQSLRQNEGREGTPYDALGGRSPYQHALENMIGYDKDTKLTATALSLRNKYGTLDHANILGIPKGVAELQTTGSPTSGTADVQQSIIDRALGKGQTTAPKTTSSTPAPAQGQATPSDEHPLKLRQREATKQENKATAGNVEKLETRRREQEIISDLKQYNKTVRNDRDLAIQPDEESTYRELRLTGLTSYQAINAILAQRAQRNAP